MTFGYDADVVGFSKMAGSNGLRDHGKSLARAVKGIRTKDIQARPLIFIAHSLGGLVCEQALLLCRDELSLRPIFEATAGIIFMGTPHYGSNLASWGTSLGKMLKFFRRTNTTIVESLEPQSETLRAVEEDFQSLLKNRILECRIHCFYETVANTAIGKIVESNSAILNGYPNSGINATHSGMTRFSGPADVGYQSVVVELRDWVDAIQVQDDQPANNGHTARSNQDTAENLQGSQASSDDRPTLQPSVSISGGTYQGSVIQSMINSGGKNTFHLGPSK